MRSDAIPRGRYYVAVNAQLGPSLSAPFAPTYSPGVTALDDAQAIELRDGERKTDVAIVVRPLKETTVSGIVVTEGDQPVADAEVMVAPVDHRVMVMSSTRTDVTGTFRLRVLTGVTYVMRATARASSDVRQVEVTLVVDQAQDRLRLSLPQ